MGNFFEVTGSGGTEGKVDFKAKGTANLVLENSNTLPGSGVVGQVYWKSNTDEFYIYNGTTWQLINTPSGITFPILAPDGTAGAPSYAFSSSTNSGMFYNSAGGSIELVQNGNAILETGTSGHRITLVPPSDPTFSLTIAADLSAFIIASPLNLWVSSSAIKWGTSNQLTLTAANPSAINRTINLPDPGTTTADVVLTESAQSINGAKTFNGNVRVPDSGTVGTPQLQIGAANTGFYTAIAGRVALSCAATAVFQATSTSFQLLSGIQFITELSTNQIEFDHGGTGNITINAPAAAAGRTYTIPDSGTTTANFMMTEGTQTINGLNTFSNDLTVQTRLVLTGNSSGQAISCNESTSSSLQWLLQNTGSGDAQLLVSASSGDPMTHYTSGATDWVTGADTSDSHKYKISFSAHLGTTDQMVFTGSSQIVSGADNTIDFGISGNRWANIWGVTIHSGDIELENKWRITEGDKVGHPEEGVMFLSPEGKKYKIAMTEVE